MLLAFATLPGCVTGVAVSNRLLPNRTIPVALNVDGCSTEVGERYPSENGKAAVPMASLAAGCPLVGPPALPITVGAVDVSLPS